jgi:NAD(P)-dependent dehydrogenase (short-subunit alcohol dehydrogenase family)
MSSVLVTGASTGIGEACTTHLDQLGHRVFAGIRRQADADRINEATTSRVQPVILDVTSESDIEAVAKEIDAATGPAGLDGLVNNAGVAMGGPIEFLELDEWRNQFEVNVFGQLAVTKAMVPIMRRASGRVVFISSIAGRVSSSMMGPYAASKHALEAIGVSLREELLPWGMHVAMVQPGAIETPIWEKGRATSQRLLDSIGPEATEMYREPIDGLISTLTTNEEDGIEPSEVATVVAHALFNPRPKYRYLVGTDAKIAATLERALPDKAFAAVVRRLG